MTLGREAPKRKALDIALPEKGEDPAERKRLLNVLAQRRYRQRRKEHVKSLEVEARKSRSTSVTSPTTDVSPIEVLPPISEATAQILDQFEVPDSYFQPPEPAQSQLFDDPFATCDPNFVTFPTDLQNDWTQLPSIPNSPLSTTDPSNLSLSPFNSESTRTPPDYQWTFPDDANLEVLELKLLHGAMSIAKRLKVEELMWSLEATSRFTDPSTAWDILDLPANYKPTRVQLNYPHHPFLDILPWPTVRDKLILVFSAPPEVRPKCASSPTALLEFVYDIEDTAEGVRIWGEDAFSDQAWEVGEKVFSNWWWAFDMDVIRRSNELKQRRGAKLLGMQGSVLGEVA